MIFSLRLSRSHRLCENFILFTSKTNLPYQLLVDTLDLASCLGRRMTRLRSPLVPPRLMLLSSVLSLVTRSLAGMLRDVPSSLTSNSEVLFRMMTSPFWKIKKRKHRSLMLNKVVNRNQIYPLQFLKVYLIF